MRQDNEKSKKSKGTEKLTDRLHEDAPESPQHNLSGIQQGAEQGNQGNGSRLRLIFPRKFLQLSDGVPWQFSVSLTENCRQRIRSSEIFRSYRTLGLFDLPVIHTLPHPEWSVQKVIFHGNLIQFGDVTALQISNKKIAGGGPWNIGQLS